MGTCKDSLLPAEMILYAQAFYPDDRLWAEKLAALLSMILRVRAYLNEQFDEQRLIRPFALKKVDQLKMARTKSDIAEIVAAPRVRHLPNGDFVPANEFVVPEEECMMWSITSSYAPLPTAAMHRFLELFTQIYPEHAAEVDTEE